MTNSGSVIHEATIGSLRDMPTVVPSPTMSGGTKGQSIVLLCRNDGSFHHSLFSINCLGSTLLEIRSAGLCLVEMCLQFSLPDWIDVTRVATKASNCPGCYLIQKRTSSLSLHTDTGATVKLEIFNTLPTIPPLIAAHNSSCGIDSVLTGAALPLRHSNVDSHPP